MKVALYERYSGQEDLDRHTLALQHQSLTEHCQEQGYQIINTYQDSHHSRFTTTRPALQQMLADAQQGAFQRILVYDQSRFSGDIAHSRQLKRDLAEIGIDVLGITDFPSDTIEGKYVNEQLLLTEEFIKRKEASKSVATKLHRWQSGYWVAPAPFGYRFNKKKHLLEIHKEESLVVRDIFTLAVERYLPKGALQHSIQSLANRFCKSWNGIKYILRNRVYLGEVIYKGQWTLGIHQKQIPLAIFEAVQHRFRPDT